MPLCVCGGAGARLERLLVSGRWCGRDQIAGWREREANSGRFYNCERQTVGGFPFRIEVRCIDPSIELRRNEPPVALKASDLVVVAQIYQPTLLISELGRADDNCRVRPVSKLTSPIGRSGNRACRHAGGTRAGVDRVRSTDGRSRRRQCASDRAESRSDRAARADRGRAQ